MCVSSPQGCFVYRNEERKVLDLKKKGVDLKRKEVRFTLNKITKPMVVPISNKLAQLFAQVPWPIEDEGLLSPASRAFNRAGYPFISESGFINLLCCLVYGFMGQIARSRNDRNYCSTNSHWHCKQFCQHTSV